MEAYGHTGLPAVDTIPVYREFSSELCQGRHPPHLDHLTSSTSRTSSSTCPVQSQLLLVLVEELHDVWVWPLDWLRQSVSVKAERCWRKQVQMNFRDMVCRCLNSRSSGLPAGTGDTVAVMITELFGKEILSMLERNETVLVSVMVGQRGPAKNINRGSLVFVSLSFIVLMIISSAWLIFYFIQKIRDTNARDRSQRRLGDAAKKAISKLTTRTVKRGDK
ncbi:hypothetical protein NFI96_000968, partial [Prochilodus magdalenae]